MNQIINHPVVAAVAFVSLPTEVEQALSSWLLEEDLDLKSASDLLRSRYQITMSLAQLEKWRQLRVRRLQCEQFAAHRDAVNELVALGSTGPDQTFDTVLQLVGQVVFDRMSAQEPEPKSMEMLNEVTKLALSVKTMRLKEREAALEETKHRDHHAQLLAKTQAAEKAAAGGNALADSLREEIETKFNFF